MGLATAERRAQLQDPVAAAARQGAPDVTKEAGQALAGKALRSGSGNGKAPESAAAERLLASWKHIVDDNLFSV